MIGIAADFFEVVVFARHPQTLLGINHPGMGRLFHAQKDILERHHARIGEQERRIAGWNNRRAGHDAMAAVGKKTQKTVSNLVSRHGSSSFGRWAHPTKRGSMMTTSST